MTETLIEFSNVEKQYNTNKVVNNLSFKVEKGDFITILGASGSGKTTTLKMINRLVEPDSGKIIIHDQIIQEINVNDLRRQIGYVVQQIGLFPHMTVEKNIATVPELLGWNSDRIKSRVEELLNLVQLPYEEFKGRHPKQLSGGQQQRVGVARALAADPDIMLLDEPFGAVDAITRMELQQQIKQIHQKLGEKTFLFVTHDINEAFKLGTKVMIMNEGELNQYDTPENIINSPKTPYVKRLLDTAYQEEAIWRDLK